MDYPRDNAFTFLFSTYKRTAGIAFAAILIIAIPVTLSLLGRQQDVRQRAQEVANPHPACSTDADCQPGFACMGSGSGETPLNTCQPVDTKSSCTTDTDCPDAWSCQTVGVTDSMPGTEIKQCAPGPTSNGRCQCDGMEINTTMTGDPGKEFLQTTVHARVKGPGNAPQSLTLYEMSDDNPTTATVFRTFEGNGPNWNFSLSGLNSGKSYRLVSNILSCTNSEQLSQVTPTAIPTPLPDRLQGVTLFMKTCNSIGFKLNNTSCSTDSDCPSDDYKCEVVGATGSIPGTEIKQCIAKSEITCRSDSDCSSGSSCAWTVAESYPQTYRRKCIPGAGKNTPSIFDLNDDGKLNGVDFNILYSNFSSRQGD